MPLSRIQQRRRCRSLRTGAARRRGAAARRRERVRGRRYLRSRDARRLTRPRRYRRWSFIASRLRVVSLPFLRVVFARGVVQAEHVRASPSPLPSPSPRTARSSTEAFERSSVRRRDAGDTSECPDACPSERANECVNRRVHVARPLVLRRHTDARARCFLGEHGEERVFECSPVALPRFERERRRFARTRRRRNPCARRRRRAVSAFVDEAALSVGPRREEARSLRVGRVPSCERSASVR